MSRHSSQSNEYFNIIEKCVQIPKDDRLFLRQCIHNQNSDLQTIINQSKKKNDQRRLYMDLRKFLSLNKNLKVMQKKHQKENFLASSPQKQPSRQNSIRANNPRSLSKQLQCVHINNTAEKTQNITPYKLQDRMSQNTKFYTSGGNKEVQKFDDTLKKHVQQQQKKWTEEEIVKKYADLFTAPDFLNKHRAISQDTDPDSKDFNFAIPCQSFVCQPKYYALQNFTAESIFKYIFQEPSLLRISKNFFQFKMEAFYEDIQDETPDIQEMFLFIDKNNDGYIDVNELGTFLDFVCDSQTQHECRQLFQKLDTTNQGYFTEQQMLQLTRDRGLTRNYFMEFDLQAQGKITYWEFFLRYFAYQIGRQSTQLGQMLTKILK